MQISRLAIKNYQFVFILLILVVFAGLMAYQSMPKSEDPSLVLPNYSVVAVYPGTSVEDMEELIVNPIEEDIYALDDIKTIRTKVEEGLMIMRVEADFSVDVEEKYDEINSILTSLQPELPKDIFLLEVNKFSPEDMAIVQMALTTEVADYAQLESTGKDLKKLFKLVKGIREVELVAFPDQQVEIQLDLDKMALKNISLQQLMQVLQSNNMNIPAGDVDMGSKSISIQSTGKYKNLEELRQTVVGSYQDRLIFLKDIATVDYGYEEANWLGRFNGKQAIFLKITQKKGENILTTTKALLNRMQEVQALVPANMQLEVAFMQAPAVDDRIYDFIVNLLQGIFLVGLIVLLFLGGRSAIIVMTVIPISILIAIGVLDLSGFGLQQISIAGLVIALGLLVDNGIVVIENILRFRKKGLNREEASIKGTNEVGIAIISSTITTLLAFFPLTQLGGGTGAFLQTLPLIVIFALIASLILALVLSPILSSRLLRKKNIQKSSIVDRVLGRIIKNVYTPVLQFSLKRAWLVVLIVVAGLAGAITLFPSVGVSFFPTADKPLVLIDVETPLGSNLEKTDKAVQFVEELLDTMDLVDSYVSNVGHGNPQVYYNRIPENYKKNYGQLVVNLKEWNPEKFYAFIGFLRTQFLQYPLADITISELKNGPPFEAPIEIKVLGSETDSLQKYAALVSQVLIENEGVTDVFNPYVNNKTLLRVRLNTDKAALLGIQRASVDVAVRTAMEGLLIDQSTFDNNEEYDLIFRLKHSSDQVQLNDWKRIYIQSLSGAMIPLSHVASLAFESGLHQIDHYNTERAATITANVFDSDQTTPITMAIIEKLETINLPAGYSFYIGGEYETQQSSFGDLGMSMSLALLAIFAVLVLQFRSMTQPLIVFSAIPFAFMGSVIALYLTGWSFSFFAFVGFTSLVGIVVNNSIILVDYSNQLIAGGKTTLEAIVLACQTRFKPIILTSVTTILGLLPLTLSQTSLWSPLGWTIIGGMLTSTFLVLLLVPIFYRWFSANKKR